MKKKNALILGILLLVAVTTSVVAVTYSKYISTATGTADAKVATWKVKVNETDIVQENTFTLTGDYITWSETEKVASGYIAPGRTGTMKVKLDTAGSKVAVKYTVSIDVSSLASYSQIKITKVNGATAPAVVENKIVYTGTISLANVDTAVEIPIELQWANADATNESDTTIGSTKTNFSIPVTVTVEQDI